jgi:hypothetical protein
MPPLGGAGLADCMLQAKQAKLIEGMGSIHSVLPDGVLDGHIQKK